MREIAGRRTEIVTRRTGLNRRCIASLPPTQRASERVLHNSGRGVANSPRRFASKSNVSVRGPRMRFWISLLTLSGVLLLGSLPGSATPIKVDLKKLVDQAEN